MKAYLEIITKLLLQSNHRMSRITAKNIRVYICGHNLTTKMAEIEKEVVKFPVMCLPVARGNNIKWQHLLFSSHIFFSCIKKNVKSGGHVGL